MDVARLVLDYIDVLKWPLLIVILVTTFKPQLLGLLRRVTEIGGPAGFNAKFSEQIEEFLRGPGSESLARTARSPYDIEPSQRFEYDGDYDDLLAATDAFLDGQAIDVELVDHETMLHGLMFVLGLIARRGKILFDEAHPTHLRLIPNSLLDAEPSEH